MTYELQNTEIIDADASPEAANSADINFLAGRAIQFAEAAARQQPLNYGFAQLPLGNVARLFNGYPAILATDFEALDMASQQQLVGFAASAYNFVGDPVQAQTHDEVVAEYRGYPAEAQVDLLGHGFNALVTAAQVGTNLLGDIEPQRELALRALVWESGHVFAGTLKALGAIGHPLATDPRQRKYFEDYIDAGILHAQLSATSHISEAPDMWL